MSGILYIVATPIGNLQDISQRALEILAAVDCIAAEDTRHSKKLLQQYLISTPLISFHEHSTDAKRDELLAKLQAGQSIALISDAGTPLISDPGYVLVAKAHEQGIKVSPIPGCCAAIAALSVSGLPSEHFRFMGFLPSKASARTKLLENLKYDSATLIFYEAPHRIIESVTVIVTVFGDDRPMCIAREITKAFETIKTAPGREILQWLESDINQQRGEFVVLVQGASETLEPDYQEAFRVQKILANALPNKDAIKLAAEIAGVSKNILYQQLMKKD